MALINRNRIWYWRKMVDGVMFNRSTKTDDKKLAETLARKWEHKLSARSSTTVNGQ